MGERLLCKQEVVGSIPITSTTERAKLVSRCGSGCVSNRESTRANDAKHRLSRSATAALLRRESTGGRAPGGAASEGRLIDREKKVCPWV